MPDFLCASCGQSFAVRDDVLARFPGWVPRQCLPCKNGRPVAAPVGVPSATPAASGRGGNRGAAAARRSAPARPRPSQSRLTVVEDPQSGVFTDGACSGNPGPGGWGLVWVRDGEVLAERAGRAAHTTNNRMELQAMMEAFRLLPRDSAETIWSDSNLVVKTVNEWAAGWERRGWKRKDGPVENLDLVRQLWAERQAHPRVVVRWLRGHAGQRFNEHADRLATGAIEPGRG